MARLELRVFIRAAPEKVWPVISNLQSQKKWMVDLRSLEVTHLTQNGVGTVMDVRSELFGLPILHDVMEITTWDPPRELGILHRGQFTGTAAFQLEALGGGTVFTWTEEFTPPLGPIGELAFALVVRPHLRRVFGRSMDNARRLVEGEPLDARPAMKGA